jgi:SAM-dependent methyltransferase
MNQKIDLVQRVEFIKNICQGKKVLHLGCTDAPFTKDSIEKDKLLHFSLREISNELYGFDISQEGLDILTENGTENLFYADLERLEEVELDETFDVIVAGEMIEHLSNPGQFLQGVKRFMNDQTLLVITTVNAFCAVRFAFYFLKGQGGINEPVHPDHVAYYSYRTLHLLIDRANLSVEDFYFYDIGKEYRVHNNKFANLINDISVKISPHLSEGVIAVCKKRREEPV